MVTRKSSSKAADAANVNANAAYAAGDKLTEDKRLGLVLLAKVVIKHNKTKGTPFISTPYGAVYAKLNEVKPGLHMVVQLNNGMYALNAPTTEERMGYLAEQKAKYPEFSIAEIKAELGLI